MNLCVHTVRSALVNAIPVRLALEVIRDGAGRWDTRTIDLELGRRGAHIESGIVADLRQIAAEGLIREWAGEDTGTGPRWSLTEQGTAWLERR